MANQADELRLDRLFGIGGKVAVVTGGSSGIGRMVASGLVANGARVLIVARGAERATATAEELDALPGDGSCSAVVADVTTDDGRATIAAAVEEDEVGGGRCHVLVNNAGIVVPDPIGEATPHSFDAVMSTNVAAPFLLTQALLSALRSAASADDPARVVMVGSVDGLRVPVGPLFSYGASKAALHTIGRELAHALAAEHITVNSVAPGLFPSDMTAGMLAAPGMQERVEGMIPLGRIGSAADVAGAVLFLVSRAGAYLTGAVIPVDGGVSTHG